MAIRLEFIKICKYSKAAAFHFLNIPSNHMLGFSTLRVTTNEEKQKYWFTHVFLAGCTGGIVKSICACPIELSKVRLQVKVSKLSK